MPAPMRSDNKVKYTARKFRVQTCNKATNELIEQKNWCTDSRQAESPVKQKQDLDAHNLYNVVFANTGMFFSFRLVYSTL